MASTALTGYHFIVFVWYSVISSSVLLIKANDHTPPEGVFLYGGQWKYLTVLNLILQTVFYGVSFMVDVLQLINQAEGMKLLTSWRDLLYSVLAFPVGAFVFTSFWALYSINRELVYPKNMDLFIPDWLNHSMHTAVFPLILLDTLATPHRYPSRKNGLTILGFFSICYLSWVLWIYLVVGEWVYPLLGSLSSFGLVAFFSASLLLIVSLYALGENLTNLIWGNTKQKIRIK